MEDINISSKKCGFCGEAIRQDARRCPYCGSILEISIQTPEESLDSHKATIENIENTEGFVNESETPVTETLESEIPSVSDNNPYTPVESSAVPKYQSGGQVQATSKPMVSGINTRRPLSNGMKVFLTTLCAIIPGLGQLTGIIAAIVFMNSEDDADRKSFGLALLVSSLVVFLFSFIFFIGLIIVIAATRS